MPHYGCVKLKMSIDIPGTIQNCGVVYSIGGQLINQLTSYTFNFCSEKTVIKCLPAQLHRETVKNHSKLASYAWI